MKTFKFKLYLQKYIYMYQNFVSNDSIFLL